MVELVLCAKEENNQMIKLERVNRDYFSVRGHPGTRIHRKAHVDSTVKIQDKVHVGANCAVLDYAVLRHDTSVLGNGAESGPIISGAAVVTGSIIAGTARVDGSADIASSYVGGDSRISGNTQLRRSTTHGTVCVGDRAVIIQSSMMVPRVKRHLREYGIGTGG